MPVVNMCLWQVFLFGQLYALDEKLLKDISSNLPLYVDSRSREQSFTFDYA